MIRIKISFGIIKIDGNICCRKVASLSTYERARAEAHVTLNLVTHYGWPFVAKFNNVYLYATLVKMVFLGRHAALSMLFPGFQRRGGRGVGRWSFVE